MQSLLFGLLIVIPAIIFWVLAWIFISRRYYYVKHVPHETHWVTTEDGWTLALHRRRPETRRYRQPVICCHGLGANRYNLDWPGHSVAGYLADLGFDTFTVETRGCGMSETPRLFGAKRWNFTFDDLVNYDAPALVRKVCDITGEKDVLWLGHSMGGMIAYGVVGKDDVPIKAAIAIASPAAFEHLVWARKITFLAHKLTFLRRIPQSAIMALTAPFAARWRPEKPRLMANAANMGIERTRRLVVNLITDVSFPMLIQAAKWIDTHEFLSEDGTVDYLKRLEDVDTPMQILVGSADLLAPPASVRAAYDSLKSEDKQWLLIGRETGAQADYGHGDIVFGHTAIEDVFKPMGDFLVKHASQYK